MLVRRRKETEKQTGGDSWKERKRERVGEGERKRKREREREGEGGRDSLMN